MESTKIEYTRRRGIARTKYGDKWVIDHSALVIDESVKIPDESINKVISVPIFEWAEPIDDNIKLSNDKLKVEEQRKNAIANTEIAFKSFCIANNIKYKSKTYYKYQHIYFNGAIAAIGNEVPAKWGVAIMSSREVIEDYGKV